MNHSSERVRKIGFIGAGKVGCTLGRFFAENGGQAVQVTGYASRSFGSAQQAAALIPGAGAKAFRMREELIETCDMIFLTVPDGAITQVYRELTEQCPDLLQGKLLYHCSGALAAQAAFPGAALCGLQTASVHPLFPVSNKETVWKELKDAFFCLEGDPEAASAAEVLLHRCGVRTQRIDPADKVKYHAGCVFASNLVCALLDESFSLLEDCGFTPEGAREAIAPLALSNLNHVLEVGAVQALTGPVERCDAGTVAKHLEVLTGEQADLYRILSTALTRIGEKKHPETDYTALRTLLQKRRNPE